jgi:hypothetical protein
MVIRPSRKWVITCTALLLTYLLIWHQRLAGKGMSRPPQKPKLKSVKEFVENTPSVTGSQRDLFGEGNRLFRLGDFEGAIEAYTRLLGELPGNTIVLYNLELSKGRRG